MILREAAHGKLSVGGASMLMYPRSRYDDAVDESETDDVVVDVSRMPFPPIDNRLPPYR